MKSKIVDYISEEVWRQGHDITKPDGLIRVSWMLEAWVYAMGLGVKTLTWKHIQNIGRLVEQEKNKGGFRKVDVWVGNRKGVAPSLIRANIDGLVRAQEIKPVLDRYRQFEEIHPFVDGNGRTGKILLNYLNGSMDEPFFPPNDFWGYPIRNP